MKATYRHKIEGLDLIIVDDILPKSDLQSLYKFFSSIKDWRRERGTPESRHWHLASDFPLATIENVPPFNTMRDLVREYFPNETLTPYRAYCNLTRYGDECTSHRDCAKGSLDLTGLFYANAEWSIDSGGETLFYNDQGDTIAAVNPKPGRIVLFRGAILHRNGVPTQLATDVRYSVAYKFAHS